MGCLTLLGMFSLAFVQYYVVLGDVKPEYLNHTYVARNSEHIVSKLEDENIEDIKQLGDRELAGGLPAERNGFPKNTEKTLEKDKAVKGRRHARSLRYFRRQTMKTLLILLTVITNSA